MLGHSGLRHEQYGDEMSISLGSNAPFNRGDHSANKHLRTDTREVSDWLQSQFRKTSAKEIAEQGGIGQRAAEGVKQGRNGLTMAHLVNMCRANPEFRAELFKFCGGHLEGEPEMVAALSRAINAIVRKEK